MKPFLKWAGGKRQLLPIIREKIAQVNFENGTFYEPFVGAGAVFLDLGLNNVVISDINKEVINCYITIKEKPAALILKLSEHQRKNNKEYYYFIREMDRYPNWSRLGSVNKAARTIYLKRTCFNGLYRVNMDGKFNVPYGKNSNPKIIDENNLTDISTYLNQNNVRIQDKDFEIVVNNAMAGDLVYFDPPYDTVSTTSYFTEYTSEKFDRNEQERLKKVVDNLTQKGVYVLLSNAKTDFILELYKDYKPYENIVQASRNINSNAEKRGCVEEILISNFIQVDNLIREDIRLDN